MIVIKNKMEGYKSAIAAPAFYAVYPNSNKPMRFFVETKSGNFISYI